MLLWTGYGPLQEGMQLWPRVFSPLMEPSTCPEARCTFTSVTSFNSFTSLNSFTSFNSFTYLTFPSSFPDDRCTFTTDGSLANQEAADATVFHMPNFHWDG